MCLLINCTQDNWWYTLCTNPLNWKLLKTIIPPVIPPVMTPRLPRDTRWRQVIQDYILLLVWIYLPGENSPSVHWLARCFGVGGKFSTGEWLADLLVMRVEHLFRSHLIIHGHKPISQILDRLGLLLATPLRCLKHIQWCLVACSRLRCLQSYFLWLRLVELKLISRLE